MTKKYKRKHKDTKKRKTQDDAVRFLISHYLKHRQRKLVEEVEVEDKIAKQLCDIDFIKTIEADEVPPEEEKKDDWDFLENL